MYSQTKYYKKIIFVLSFGIFFSLTLFNFKINTTPVEESKLNIFGAQISSYVPTANASEEVEIYCWSCPETDICGHVPGFVCCWSDLTGFKPCRQFN